MCILAVMKTKRPFDREKQEEKIPAFLLEDLLVSESAVNFQLDCLVFSFVLYFQQRGMWVKLDLRLYQPHADTNQQSYPHTSEC